MAIETTDFTPDEIAALAVLADLSANHFDGVETLLQMHRDKPAPKENVPANMIKLLANIQERGDFFTPDLEDMAAHEANYFSLGGLFGKIASKVGEKVQGAAPALGAAGQAAGVPAPLGEAGAGILGNIFSKLGDTATSSQGQGLKGFLGNLFGKKGAAPTPAEVASSPSTAELLKAAGITAKPPEPKPTFYEEHKTAIWVSSSIVVVIVVILIIRAIMHHNAGSKK